MFNLTIKNLSKSYNQPLLDRIGLSHTGKGVIAIIGDNGSGKSTFLKIIASIEEPDSGEVVWDRNLSLGYLTQEVTDHETLSGGQKKLAKLAELLYSNTYDVILLDEPDNHLDLDNKLWLEKAIRDFNGLIIMISHDRVFLENVTTHVWLLENHQIGVYPFGYQKFRQIYEEEESAKADLYKTQLKEKKRLAEMALMFRDKGLIGAYRNTQKRLARLQAGMVENPRDKKAQITIKTSISGKIISKKTAILIKDLVFGYDQPLFDHANLHLFVQDKTALLSPNGTGKSTLIKLLLGELLPQQGSAKIGDGLKVGYYSQEHSQTLPAEETPRSLFSKKYPLFDYEVDAILKNFFFTKQTAKSKIWTLSGGQKSRLQLALFLYTNPDLLILDEPTNHLDLKSIAALENFLKEYQGTILLISHDRELVENVCDNTYTIAGRQIKKV